MRKPSRISPSALARFEKDRESFYLTYCAEPRPEREPQSKPASVGSAFDAYVKSQLMSDIFGEPCFGELFEQQVEPQNREFALTAGRHVMENYVASGAYGNLLDLLEDAEEAPQFEFDADVRLDDQIPIAGKPDCRFVHKGGAHIVLDWKVNGYCGKGNNATSPSPGYMLCLDGQGWPEKGSRSHKQSHKLFSPAEFLGITVNKFFMEQVSIDWADQLTMYGWMMGEPVGSEEMVVCIEQVVAKPTSDVGAVGGDLPKLRFATHRCRVSQAHQFGLIARLNAMWEALQSEYIFTELDRDGSIAHQTELDARALSMVTDGTVEGDFFAKCARPTTFYKGR